MASAVAAPNPEINPDKRPSAKVLRMQSTPIGPTGAAMEIPMSRPRRNVGIEFVMTGWLRLVSYICGSLGIAMVKRIRGGVLRVKPAKHPHICPTPCKIRKKLNINKVIKEKPKHKNSEIKSTIS